MPPADHAAIPAIVLAAGGSARLGHPKQLMRLEGLDESLLERALRLARESGAAPVFVVLGAHAEAIQSALDLSACIVLMNPGWSEGMAGSLRLGIAAVLEQCPAASGALLMVCDQPAVSADHLRRLLASHWSDPDSIAVSHYAGRCGVPVVAPRDVFPALRGLSGDQGARAIFGSAGSGMHSVELTGGEWDIDTMEDIRSMEVIQD